MAIEAWEARQRSIPVPASRDRAAWHRNKRAPVPATNPVAATPALAPTPVLDAVPAAAPAVSLQGRPQRDRRAKVQFNV